MSSFTIYILETNTYKITVHAEDEDAAVEAAHEIYATDDNPWESSAETESIVNNDTQETRYCL